MIWIKENLGLVVTAIFGPLITWFVTKRHQEKLEAKRSTSNILENNLKIYQSLVDDLRERLEDLNVLLHKREDEIEKLKQKLEDLRERIEQLETI